MATAEFSKFAGILSAALLQHHFLGLKLLAGILSPPLALFIVMLPQAHLTSHSRVSDHTIVVIWRIGVPYQELDRLCLRAMQTLCSRALSLLLGASEVSWFLDDILHGSSHPFPPVHICLCV